MTGKQNPDEEVNLLHSISLNENMNRRRFLQKSTLVLGTAMGAIDAFGNESQNH